MEPNQLSNRKRKIEEMEGEDRLSDLPDCLLHHIFLIAGTEHVVKTCIKWPETLELSSLRNLETLKLVGLFSGSFSVCALNLKTFDILNMEKRVPYSDCEFVIVAPKLIKFKFDGYPPKLFSPKNLSSLDQIEIDMPSNRELNLFTNKDMKKKEYALKVLQMLNAFPIAKTITLSMNVIQALSYAPALLSEHPSQISNLKYLKVKSSKSTKKVMIPSIILDYFLTSSPLLETSLMKRPTKLLHKGD
ncbi:uncharacterized protein LOC130014762 [Mercurialis annua]|uniref:uncharacterized protein LOC130014762 n=1 Tax=Mercurialis annua TaxID=3986 RepID=UPI0024AD7728|nr:uncharacterized protein LOC130014762 [Mercurialis annua]